MSQDSLLPLASDPQRQQPPSLAERLYRATLTGNVEALDQLLAEPGANIDVTWYGNNLLFSAIMHNQPEVAEYLVNKGIDFEFRSLLYIQSYRPHVRRRRAEPVDSAEAAVGTAGTVAGDDSGAAGLTTAHLKESKDDSTADAGKVPLLPPLSSSVTADEFDSRAAVRTSVMAVSCRALAVDRRMWNVVGAIDRRIELNEFRRLDLTSTPQLPPQPTAGTTPPPRALARSRRRRHVAPDDSLRDGGERLRHRRVTVDANANADERNGDVAYSRVANETDGDTSLRPRTATNTQPERKVGGGGGRSGHSHDDTPTRNSRSSSSSSSSATSCLSSRTRLSMDSDDLYLAAAAPAFVPFTAPIAAAAQRPPHNGFYPDLRYRFHGALCAQPTASWTANSMLRPAPPRRRSRNGALPAQPKPTQTSATATAKLLGRSRRALDRLLSELARIAATVKLAPSAAGTPRTPGRAQAAAYWHVSSKTPIAKRLYQTAPHTSG